MKKKRPTPISKYKTINLGDSIIGEIHERGVKKSDKTKHAKIKVVKRVQSLSNKQIGLATLAVTIIGIIIASIYSSTTLSRGDIIPKGDEKTPSEKDTPIQINIQPNQNISATSVVKIDKPIKTGTKFNITILYEDTLPLELKNMMELKKAIALECITKDYLIRAQIKHHMMVKFILTYKTGEILYQTDRFLNFYNNNRISEEVDSLFSLIN